MWQYVIIGIIIIFAIYKAIKYFFKKGSKCDDCGLKKYCDKD
jgi:hypothetical protein